MEAERKRRKSKLRQGRREAGDIVRGYPMLLHYWTKGFMEGSPGNQTEEDAWQNLRWFLVHA